MRELLENLSWIDLTALAVVIVFFVLGLFRGMVWQISRVATLVAAYVLSGWFGPRLGNVTTRWFPESAAPEIPQYVAYFMIFLVALILFSLLAGIVHRFVQQSALSLYNRVGGGLLGIATGWLIVMTLLTGVQMAHGSVGFGTSIAEAAAQSRSSEVSDVVLRTTGRALPDDWRSFTDEWRHLLRGDAENPGEDTDPRPESIR